ncbi:MAG: transcriptional regulator, family [Caulobacteraceae bacterium]|nr:transcriptional regulator, family [Caulobacteraceae bacterium]
MTNEIDRHLGKRLRQRRRMLGQTQQQIAEAVGVRFQQIQKYECGANRISAARLWLLAKALEAPVGSFFDGLGEEVEMVAEEDADPDKRRAASVLVA